MRYFTLLIACWSTVAAWSQEHSTYPDLPTTTFEHLAVSGEQMVAVGNCQQLWYSEDLADSWTRHTIADEAVFEVLFHPNNPQQAVYANSRGIHIFDLDQGSTVQSLPLPSDFIKMIKQDGDRIFALGSQKIYVCTLSNEPQWELYFNLWDVLNLTGASLSLSEDYVHVGAASGDIVRIDRSNLQYEVITGTTSSIREFIMLDNDYGIFSSEGKVYLTENGFEEIVETNFPINRELHLPGRDTIISTLGLSLRYSTDGGQTSTFTPTSMGPLFGTIESGIVLPDGAIYLYGQGATVVRTTDFGNTWQFPASAYPRTDLNDVTLTPDGQLYTCGEYGRLLRSADGDNSWTDIVYEALREKELQQLAVLEAEHLLFTTAAGELLRLREGVIENIYTADTRSLFQDQNNGYLLLQRKAFNDPSHQLLRSTDGGETWEQVLQVGGDQYWLRIAQAEDGSLYFATDNGDIYTSTNQGVSWTTQPTGQDIEWIYRQAGIFYAISSRFELSRSTDDGSTWEELYNAYLLRNATFIGENEIYLTYATNNQTNLIHTIDGGATWERVFQNCSPTQDMLITPQGDLLMVQDAGHINLYDLTITSSSEVTPTDADVNWLFPNPIVRGQILYIAPEVSMIRVYDLQGRLVLSSQDRTLATAQLPASGLYLLQLHTATGNRVEKLVVH